VFKHSSNIGTIKIARRIGKEALWKALVRFGFGRPTHVGLPGERRGILRPASRWREIGFATHAFGQGLTVTPLQLAVGFAAIAAHGVYRPPRLALHYITPDGKVEPVARPPGARGEERVMSESAARTLLAMMQGVTEDGTAKAAAIPGYPVAGKTGTAQKVVGGRYDPSKYLSSFVGIVPANDPRLVIAVMIDEPVGKHYGGLVAAPAFKSIAQLALSHLGVAPTAPMAAKPRSPGRHDEKAVEPTPERPGLDEPAALLTRGESGRDDDALAEADELAVVDALPEDHMVLLPDFTGMSMGEAIRAARTVGVELVPSGSGLAGGQTPGPGPVTPGTLCRVSFQRVGG
jgi:cell division protein FtsI (penicillin-binding protein 3)